MPVLYYLGWAHSTAPILAAGVGTFSLTGQAAGLLAARRLACGAGTFALAGQAAGLKVGKTLSAAVGTFALTGQATGLFVGRTVVASGGMFTLTGQAAGLFVGRTVAATPGMFALAGQSANLTTALILPAAGGSFGLTGQPAGLHVGRLVTADPGFFTITGLPAGLLRPPVLVITDAADGGGYTATITESQGAANSLYYRRITGELDATAWALAGQRTGDGTITGTVPAGLYAWMVVAAQGVPDSAPTLTVADRRDGTGADATVGNTGGRLATLWAKPWGAGEWTAIGQRTGDGLIPADLSVGYYEWYASVG